jgi:tetratricopeptide (TPR) repeat protein
MIALGEAWMAQKNWDRAYAHFERALKRPLSAEHKASALSLSALASEKGGNVRRALKTYERALAATDDKTSREHLERKIAELKAHR